MGGGRAEARGEVAGERGDGGEIVKSGRGVVEGGRLRNKQTGESSKWMRKCEMANSPAGNGLAVPAKGLPPLRAGE